MYLWPLRATFFDTKSTIFRCSAAHFGAIKQSLGEPDPFRLKYQTEMIEVISEIIKLKIVKEKIELFIREGSIQSFHKKIKSNL